MFNEQKYAMGGLAGNIVPAWNHPMFNPGCGIWGANQSPVLTPIGAVSVKSKPSKRKSFMIEAILEKDDDVQNDSGFEERFSPVGRKPDNGDKIKISSDKIKEYEGLYLSNKINGYQQHPDPSVYPSVYPGKFFYPMRPIFNTESYSNVQTSPTMVYTEASSCKEKGKRSRTIFTDAQLRRLEEAFQAQQYMVGSERCQLADEMNLTEAQVKVWFQNRRIKFRKQNKKKNNSMKNLLQGNQQRESSSS